MPVHQFYTKVRKDDLPAPVFNSIIKQNRDKPRKIMCNFLNTTLLYSKKYMADPQQSPCPCNWRKIF